LEDFILGLEMGYRYTHERSNNWHLSFRPLLSNIVCFPAIFVIKLKELIISLELCLHGKTVPDSIFKDKKYRHNIKGLWKECEILLIEFSDSLKESDDSEYHIQNLSDFQRIGQIVDELYDKDSTSETFRYPFPDKNKQFVIDMNHFSENVRWVSDQMEAISDWIEEMN
jgi:hypothetical protein